MHASLSTTYACRNWSARYSVSEARASVRAAQSIQPSLTVGLLKRQRFYSIARLSTAPAASAHRTDRWNPASRQISLLSILTSHRSPARQLLTCCPRWSFRHRAQPYAKSSLAESRSFPKGSISFRKKSSSDLLTYRKGCGVELCQKPDRQGGPGRVDCPP